MPTTLRDAAGEVARILRSDDPGQVQEGALERLEAALASDPVLAHLQALVRAIPAVRRAGSASQFLGASCRMMQASDAARAVLAAPAGIYVASRASIPARAAMWRDYRRNGAPIISSWIDEAGEGETADLSELWGRIGREVASAERLVLYVTPDDFPLKGALVEVGMALTAGVPVVVVAPEVELEPRSLRPLGSWARHPLVTFASSLADALANLSSGDAA